MKSPLPSGQPFNTLRTLPGILTLRFDAGVVFIYRRVLDPPPDSSLLTALADTPFDQVEAQLETQLGEQSSLKPAFIRALFQRVRRKLRMDPHTGVAPRGSAGKKTLRQRSRNSLDVDFDHWLRWAVTRAAKETARLCRADQTADKYIRKHHEKLFHIVLNWTRQNRTLAEDTLQDAWTIATLLIEPGRRWSQRFVLKIARNLLRSYFQARGNQPMVHYLDGLGMGDELDGVGPDDELFHLTAGPDSPGVPEATEETPSVLPLAVYETLVRTIVNAPCLPSDRIMFLRMVVLRRRPRFVVRDDADDTLDELLEDIQRDFAFISHLTDETVAELFKKLREDLAKPLARCATDERHRKNYRRLLRRITGGTRLSEYFTTRDVTGRAKQVGRFAENVKRYLWDQGLKTGTSLHAAISALPADWLGRGQRTYATLPSRSLRIIGLPHEHWRVAVGLEIVDSQRLDFHFRIKDDGGGEFLIEWHSLDWKYRGESVQRTLEDAFAFATHVFGIQRKEWRLPGQD